MVIGIDVQPAMRGQKTGTEWYTVRLVEALVKQKREGEEVILYSRENLKWPFKRLWTQGRLSWEMLRRPPEVLFVPAHAVPRIHPQKTITTIHDVGFRRFPQFYAPKDRHYLEATTRFAVKKCAKIIVPSEFTKRELMELYHADSNRIVVTPLAPVQFPPISRTQFPSHFAPSQFPSHFFLTVSRLESKKNIATLIRAFEIFKSRRGVGDPFELLLAGQPGFGYAAIKELINRSPTKAFIKELGFVPDEQIGPLLQSAYAYVYPSWYEGLGISALDALASGVALVASNIPALREAAAEAALYFPPNSPEELAAVLTRLADDPSLRDGMGRRGKERAAGFSWDQTAARTWEVLRSV